MTKCSKCGYEETSTDWEGVFFIIVWTLFFGSLYFAIFHPLKGIFRNYTIIEPILSIIGVVSGAIVIIMIAIQNYDNYKEGRIDR